MKPAAAKFTLTPKLRFPEFRDGPGWATKRLGQLCKIRTGKKDANEGAETGPYPFFTCAENHIYSQSYSFDAEAILVAGNANVGQTKYYQGKFEAYQRTYVLTDFTDIHVPYLYAILSTNLRQSLLKQVQTSAMSYIKLPMLEEYELSAPTVLGEQHKIAECLSALDELIGAESQKLNALKARKKGLMQQLFPRDGETLPRLRFPEFQNAPEWVTVPMGELLARKPEYGVNAPAVAYSESLPTYLRITDIDDDGRFLSKSKASVNIDATDENYLIARDIVLARTGASVGKSYRHRLEDGRLVFAGFLVRIRPSPAMIDPVFLSTFLTTSQYWDWVRITSSRSGQPGLNGSEYASLQIPIPSAGKNGLSEQQRIASCLSSLDDLIAAQSDKLEALRIHKKGLMQQLFPSPAEAEA